MVATPVVKPPARTHALASVTDTSVYVVVLTTGVVKSQTGTADYCIGRPVCCPIIIDTVYGPVPDVAVQVNWPAPVHRTVRWRKTSCGNGLTVMVATPVVKPPARTHALASVTDTSVYVVVLTTGVVKVANGYADYCIGRPFAVPSL